MPIYEYECPKCGTIEVMRKISEKPLKKCPKCHSKVNKLVSQTSFQLKGTGWYDTDYSSKGKAKAKEKAESMEKSKAPEPAPKVDKVAPASIPPKAN
jgi:putative FmdB family regulatory protein